MSTPFRYIAGHTVEQLDRFRRDDYNQPPPGLVQEEKPRPEDCIPDAPENQAAREFLARAPTRGLWMPLGKEVKVMKCWRCKSYGHRTGDRECPLFISGNLQCEQFRYIHEDPMHGLIQANKQKEKEERILVLQQLLESSTDSDSSSSSSSSSSSTSSSEKNRKRKRHRSSKHKSHRIKKKKDRSHKKHKSKKTRKSKS